MAISRSELETLMERQPQPDSPILSVYLGLDQSRAANLNRGYVAALKDRLRAIEPCAPSFAGGSEAGTEAATPRDREAGVAPARLGGAAPARGRSAAASPEQVDRLRRALDEDCRRVVEFVSRLEPRGRGIAIFCDVSADFIWHCELYVPLRNEVRWEEKPYVRPLVEALDEYERFGLVLVNREKARVFSVYLGEIEEDREITSEEKRKRISSPGNTYARSQMNLQRREDEHALWHLKEVAEYLDRLEAKYSFDRLILAGPQDITKEFEGILPKRLQALVVKHIALPMDASEHAVLKETLRIEAEVERAREVQLVDDLITQAAKGGRAALSMDATLEAMRLGRLMKLVYVRDYTAAGVQCLNCLSLFVDGVSACPYCGAGVRPVADVVTRLVDLVVNSGGQAESVFGAAADRLKQAGSIGAFLRF